jgi:hypothetical protein
MVAAHHEKSPPSENQSCEETSEGQEDILCYLNFLETFLNSEKQESSSLTAESLAVSGNREIFYLFSVPQRVFPRAQSPKTLESSHWGQTFQMCNVF